MSQINERIAVWTTESGYPARLVWRSRRFTVSDTPTVMVDPCPWWNAMEGHEYGVGAAPLQISGWRFQATSETGESHVFDVRTDDQPDGPPSTQTGSPNRWLLLRVFD